MINTKMALSCYFSAILFALISVTVAASSVTYSVVGLPNNEGAEFGVQIDGKDIYRLLPSEEDSAILFQVEAPIAEENYRFVELEKDSEDIIDGEEFEREPIESQVNQIYGRSWTTKSVTLFKDIYKRIGVRHKTDLHPTDEIPALHIVADQDEIDNIHEHYNQKIQIKADLTFIGAYEIKKFSNVKFNIAGGGSRFKSKPSYNLKLAKGENLGNYTSFKLKASADDPTLLRNKLAIEMSLSTGSGGTCLSYKRVYLNGVAIGLYTFIENYDKTWFDQNANPDLPDYKNGVLYKATGGSIRNELSDLRYISDRPEDYGKHGYEIALEDKAEKKGFTTLASFIKFIDDQLKKPASNSTENEKELLAAWGTHIDPTIFLRGVALEFLMASFDHHLALGNNYYLYKCPVLKTFIYIYWDMEATFGWSALPRSQVLEGDYRHVEGFHNRPLAKALLRVPYYHNYFEEALANITNSIFNPSISFPIIDSLVEFVREDIEWDHTIHRINADKDFSNPPEADPKGGKLVSGKNINYPKNTDFNLYRELKNIDKKHINFQDSIDGPTGSKALFGLKEFIQLKYDNVKEHL